MKPLPLRFTLACLIAMLMLTMLPAAGPASSAQDAPGTPAEAQYAAWPPRPMQPGDLDQGEPGPFEEQESSMTSCTNTSVPSPEVVSWAVFESYTQKGEVWDWDIWWNQFCTTNPPIRIINHPADDFYARFNRDAQWVVFVSDRSGNDDIYKVRTNGKDLIRLTTHGAIDTQPVFSPDDSQVAFVSDRASGNVDIYLMSGSGGTVRRLTTSTAVDVEPDWSPDGKKIAWIRRSGTNGYLMVRNADGSGVEKVVTTLKYGGHPFWSPDGKRLAFQYDANGDGWLDIGEINIDGSGMKNISIVRVPTITTDLLLGSWYGGPGGTGLLYSNVNYYYDRRYGWTVNSAEPYFLIENDYHSYIIETSTLKYNYNPHGRTWDITPPQTNIESLPSYSPEIFNIKLYINEAVSDGTFVLETRTDQSPKWNYIYHGHFWHEPDGEVSITYQYKAKPGTTAEFRLLAADMGNNSNPADLPAQASTKVYQGHAQVHVQDARETPLSGAFINAGSAAFDQPVETVNGSADLYYHSSGNHKAAVSKPGFDTLPDPNWPVDVESEFRAILPPQGNSIANGYFEDPEGSFSGWQVEGDLSPAAVPGRYGGTGARLGLACNTDLCLTDPEQITLNSGGGGSLVVDSLGGVHNLNGILYFYRNPTGQWQQRGSLQSLDYMSSYEPLGVLPDGTAFTLEKGNKLTFAYHPVGGTWTYDAITSYSSFAYPLAAIRSDASGQVHLVYIKTGMVNYKKRLASGQWQDSISIGPVPGGYPSLVVSPDGAVHVVFLKNNEAYNAADDQIAYLRIAPDGSAGPVEYLPAFNNSSMDISIPVEIMIGADNTLYLFAYTEEHMYFWSRAPASGWSAVQQEIMPPYGTDHMRFRKAQVSPAGFVHIFFARHNSSTGFELYDVVKKPGVSGYRCDRLFTDDPVSEFAPALDPAGVLHLVWRQDASEFYYQKQQVVSAPAQSTLAQTISLPADAHQPTLSFFSYLKQAYPTTPQSIRVLLTPEGGEPVELLVDGATDPTGSWKHSWFDLSTWKGQTVKIAFTLDQPANQNAINFFLDEVTLGAWTTPTLTAVTPLRIDLPVDTSAWVTITGANFMDGAQVYFGSTPAAEVEWLSETQLRCRPPASLPMGAYTLRVENPGGASAAWPARFRVGSAFFLPVVQNLR